jgi:hypothetical protein
MSIFSNPSSCTPSEIAAYVAALLELLGDADPVPILRQTPASVERFLGTVPMELVTRPEAPGKWSVRGVVQHLADSELVGGWRLRMVLSHDRPLLKGYDQDRWANGLWYQGVAARRASSACGNCTQGTTSCTCVNWGEFARRARRLAADGS